MLRLSGGSQAYLYGEGDTGYRVYLGPRIEFSEVRRNLAGMELARLAETGSAYTEARAYCGWEPADGLRLSADAAVYLLDEKVNGAGQSVFGFLSAGYEVFKGGTVLAGGQVVSNPLYDLDVSGMVKFAYGFGTEIGGRP
jgi:hypothetical protein